LKAPRTPFRGAFIFYACLTLLFLIFSGFFV